MIWFFKFSSQMSNFFNKKNIVIKMFFREFFGGPGQESGSIKRTTWAILLKSYGYVLRNPQLLCLYFTGLYVSVTSPLRQPVIQYNMPALNPSCNNFRSFNTNTVLFESKTIFENVQASE